MKIYMVKERNSYKGIRKTYKRKEIFRTGVWSYRKRLSYIV